jgi:hypothetical protein
MKRFEVGKKYKAIDPGLDPIEVIKRSEKCITVRDVMGNEWRMKIREGEGENGCRFEFAIDNSAWRKWHDMFTYTATLELV